VVCGVLALSACTSSSQTAGRDGGSTVVSPSGAASSTSGPVTKAVPSTKVPAPTPGNLSSEVPSRTVRTAAPVSLGATADFNKQVSARLTRVARVNAQGKFPGEVSGRALSVTVAFTNSSRSAITTQNAVVNVSDKSKHPLVMLETASRRVRTSIAAGSSATGVYVFHLPAGFAAPVTVSVSYSATEPVVLFVGIA
jgi:hypothetical protein